jgi:hypothetical protein
MIIPKWILFSSSICLFIIEEGMTPAQIRELMKDCVESQSDIQFVGFPKLDRGWYFHGTGAETRAESEARAAKFFLWFCEYLDGELATAKQAKSKGRNGEKANAHHHHDLFDAGVQIQGEELENEHDKHESRIRRRRTALVLGHGDFMSLVMKRLVAGYGHYVETHGVPHRKYYYLLLMVAITRTIYLLQGSDS